MADPLRELTEGIVRNMSPYGLAEQVSPYVTSLFDYINKVSGRGQPTQQQYPTGMLPVGGSFGPAFGGAERLVGQAQLPLQTGPFTNADLMRDPVAQRAFIQRSLALENLPNYADEVLRLGKQLNPKLSPEFRKPNEALRLPNEPTPGGQWIPNRIFLYENVPSTYTHEMGHQLGWQTGLAPGEFKSAGPYAKYGNISVPIAEGAADVLSGTRGYLASPEMPPDKLSQARSIAEMILSAAREQTGVRGSALAKGLGESRKKR